jgi:hypothetical protein
MGLCMLQLWIVFHDEGISLQRFLYSPSTSGSLVMYEPSEFWRRLRLAQGGREVIKVSLTIDCHPLATSCLVQRLAVWKEAGAVVLCS